MFSYLGIRHPKQCRSGVLGARGDAGGHIGRHLHTVQGTVHEPFKSSTSTGGYTQYPVFCELGALGRLAVPARRSSCDLGNTGLRLHRTRTGHDIQYIIDLDAFRGCMHV